MHGRDDDTGAWRYIEDDVADDYNEQFLTYSASPRCKYDKFMSIVSEFLVLPHALEKLTASDLSITLWSLTKIYNPLSTSNYCMTLQSPQRVLLRGRELGR